MLWRICNAIVVVAEMSSETVLVVDIGSASLKAGYAGEDTPATIIPSIPHKYPHGLEVEEYSFIEYSHSLFLSLLYLVVN
jgi:actin-related protein